jgi:hypothetical protein
MIQQEIVMNVQAIAKLVLEMSLFVFLVKTISIYKIILVKLPVLKDFTKIPQTGPVILVIQNVKFVMDLILTNVLNVLFIQIPICNIIYWELLVLVIVVMEDIMQQMIKLVNFVPHAILVKEGLHFVYHVGKLQDPRIDTYNLKLLWINMIVYALLELIAM